MNLEARSLRELRDIFSLRDILRENYEKIQSLLASKINNFRSKKRLYFVARREARRDVIIDFKFRRLEV